MKRLIWLMVFVLGCAGTALAQARAHVAQGDLQGVQVGGTAEFKGIPYAAAPVGPLRWRPPQPAPSWSGVRDASRFGPVEVQPSPAWTDETTWIGSEDCLTLNVFTPQPDKPLPVMVYLHGGSHVWGSGSARILDGRYLAEHGLVVVTMNFRLGPFGFLALPELSAESGQGSGNYAIMDQIAALRWVHDNIAAFGGDPNRVLLCGQSAGSVDVEAILMSPQSQGLVSAAWLMSGGGTGIRSLVSAERAGTAWVAPLLQDVPAGQRLSHLRSVPAEAMAAAMRENRATNAIRYSVNVDGNVQPDTYQHLLARGEYAHVPIVVGSTRDEMANLLVGWNILPPFGVDPPDYPQAVELLSGQADLARILPQYDLAQYPSPMDALVAMRTDAGYNAPLRRMTRGLVARSMAPLYRYVFAHPFSNQDEWAAHSYDLGYVFHNLPATATDDEVALANTMSAYAIDLASTGDPNGAGLPFWHIYQRYDENYLWLDLQPHMAKHYRERFCDFWDSLIR